MKRPSVQFSVPCLGVQEDEKGPPSFNRIFYELPFPEFPFRFPKPGFFIANGWCAGQGNFVQRMKIVHPDKKAVLIETGKQPFELKEVETPFMAINLFQDVEFKEPGTYWIQVFLDDELKLEYPMVVRQADMGGAEKSKPAAAAEKPAQPARTAEHGAKSAKPKPASKPASIGDLGNISSPPRKKP
jgi:hypothetical protein